MRPASRWRWIRIAQASRYFFGDAYDHMVMVFDESINLILATTSVGSLSTCGMGSKMCLNSRLKSCSYFRSLSSRVSFAMTALIEQWVTTGFATVSWLREWREWHAHESSAITEALASLMEGRVAHTGEILLGKAFVIGFNKSMFVPLTIQVWWSWSITRWIRTR